jgi:hypothetical protein
MGGLFPLTVSFKWVTPGRSHRLLGPRGNPRADNILEIIKILQTNERVRFRVEAHKAAA